MSHWHAVFEAVGVLEAFIYHIDGHEVVCNLRGSLGGDADAADKAALASAARMAVAAVPELTAKFLVAALSNPAVTTTLEGVHAMVTTDGEAGGAAGASAVTPGSAGGGAGAGPAACGSTAAVEGVATPPGLALALADTRTRAVLTLSDAADRLVTLCDTCKAPAPSARHGGGAGDGGEAPAHDPLCLPDYLQCVADTTSAIVAVVRRHCPFIDLSPLDAVSTVPVAVSGVDFMVQYEVSWCADGSAMDIAVPDPRQLTAAHHQRQARSAISLSHHRLRFLTQCALVPCHEVLHLVQHVLGQTDSDSMAWSAEHDASRANYSMLRAVLEDPTVHARFPPSFAAYCFSAALHAATSAYAAWSAGVKAAYDEWAKSFGLVAPKGDGIDGNTRVHAQLKDVVALEGWAPTDDLLHAQLNLLFKDRAGDVYAHPLAVPDHLAVTGGGVQLQARAAGIGTTSALATELLAAVKPPH